MIDVGYAGPAVPRFSRGGDSRDPSVARVDCGPVVACPLCATTDAVVDVLAQFIDVGGRRCAHAATSSSCRS